MPTTRGASSGANVRPAILVVHPSSSKSRERPPSSGRQDLPADGSTA